MAELSFRCGPARIELSAAGAVTAVRHDAAPGASFLGSAGELTAVADGRGLAWASPVLSADADEVQVTRLAGPLQLVVRHTFSTGWGVRLTLANLGDQELVLDDPVLTWRVPGDRPAWALAAGAAASYAVLPPTGAGPLLGGVLRLGALTAASAEGLHLGRLVLAPSARYVVQWQWDFYSTPKDLDRGRHPEVPRELDLAVDEVTTIAAGEDEALVVEPGLQSVAVRGSVELSADEPGAHRVELRSARGLTAYEVRAAEPLASVLRGAATAVLAGPRTAAGVVRLADVDAALAVQRALASSLLEETELAEEALDLYTARLPEEPPPDPRTVGYLCGEHARTADPEVVGQATRALLRSWEPLPGLGLVATELCLARLLLAQPVAPVLDHLVRLAGEAALPPAATPVTAQTSLLELEVVTMARVPPAGGGAGSSVSSRAAALGGWLGAGLKGRAVQPLPVEAVAHLAAVLALLPEPLSADLARRWGCTAHQLGRRGQLDVRCRQGPAAPGPALSWLVLGARPE